MICCIAVLTLIYLFLFVDGGDKGKQDMVSSTLQFNFIAVLNSYLNLQHDVNVIEAQTRD